MMFASARLSTLGAVGAAALILAACGGSDDTSADATPSNAMSQDAGDMDDMDDMGDMGDHSSFAFGEPADAADADRTVEIEALDALAYDPATLAVDQGETITFVVTNSGQIVHEFVIGDNALQQEHEAEMAEMMASGMQMGDEPNALVLAAGETKSITWHFTEAGQLEFACHQPGHYAGGMIATVDVS